MLRRRACCGCIIALVAFVLITVVTWPLIPALYGHFLMPEQKSPVVVSPDGRYSAYVGIRGFMDNVHGRLHLRNLATGQDQIFDAVPGTVKWSPDSGKVAVVENDGCVFVYNVSDHKSCISYIKKSNGDFDSKWLDNKTIVVFKPGWDPEEGPMTVVGKAFVSEANGELKIECAKPPKMKVSQVIHVLQENGWIIQSVDGKNRVMSSTSTTLTINGNLNDYLSSDKVDEILTRAGLRY